MARPAKPLHIGSNPIAVSAPAYPNGRGTPLKTVAMSRFESEGRYHGEYADRLRRLTANEVRVHAPPGSTPGLSAV